MKKSAFSLLGFALGLSLSATALAQPDPAPQNNTVTKPAEADLAWANLIGEVMGRPGAGGEQPAEPAARKRALATRFIARADLARDFYTRFPQHAKATEARQREIEALVGAMRNGDATAEGRLAPTVQAFRSDHTVPAAIRVRAVATYEFARALHGKKTPEEQLDAIEPVARALAAEFPDEPQGYESLLAVAATNGDSAKARSLATELANGSAAVPIKQRAQTLLGRLDLVGKPLGAELDGANATATKAALAAGRPTIIYTWASWSPGSLALAAELKQRSPAANIIGLNLDKDATAAKALAEKVSLVGMQQYDDRGPGGALAQRLKISSAPQVILVDAAGIIREVRGETDLDKNLQQLGL